MPRPIIEVDQLTKRYRLEAIGATSLRDSLLRWWGRRRGAAAAPDSRDFWALRGVSFSVQPGEVMGVIGRNGAGKSTLLKILSRITEPTSGRAVLRGRVASLLEVGTGFHPDLTGRENTFLNGAILGMTKEEIRKKFDEIVAFAEVEQFIDTPVKRYSSGMYVRLAFAVAAHLEPEVLIVDEVLAVGDAQFQRKCLGKMQEVSGRDGRTVLFVSHNMAALRNICQRGLCLRQGQVDFDGPIGEALGHYLGGEETVVPSAEWSDGSGPSSEAVALRRIVVLDADGRPEARLDHRRPFRVAVEYEVRRPTKNLIVGFDLQNAEGVLVCGSNNIEAAQERVQSPGTYRTECRFPGHLFNEGRYQLRLVLHTPDSMLLTTDFCLAFEIADLHGHGPAAWKLHGVTRPDLGWSLERLGAAAP